MNDKYSSPGKRGAAPHAATSEAIEAAVFRRLVEHLRKHTEVQNIDLMILANFCRNCLSKWYGAAASERGVTISDAEARERIYGMPYDEWRTHHQAEATPEQQAAYRDRARRQSQE